MGKLGVLSAAYKHSTSAWPLVLQLCLLLIYLTGGDRLLPNGDIRPHLMDPLIALALAGNVLQFVDTARSVVSRGLEVYTSIDGTTSQDADAEFVTNDLLRLVQRLSFSNQINTQCPELAALCSRCVDVSKELVASIARIKGDGRAGRWPSLKRALMRFWNEKEIMSMEKRILAIQAEYHLRVSVDIK